MSDSRRVPKAAGRGGARYVVLYSLATAPVLRNWAGDEKKNFLYSMFNTLKI